MVMPVRFATAPRFRPLDLAPCPDIRADLDRIGERTAHRRAMEVAGPDVTG